MKATILLAVLTIALAHLSAKADSISVKLEDRAKLIDAVTAIAAGADRHDWKRVRGAFTQTVITDYTSLVGGEPVSQAADELIKQWSGFLPGFDMTQHLVTNHTITHYSGTEAKMQADFQATHRIDKDIWVLGGQYDYTLKKIDDQWFVSFIKMTHTWETGNRDLASKAAERAKNRK